MDILTEGAAKWRLTAVRVVFGFVMVTAIIAGYVGLRDLILGLPTAERGAYGTSFWSLLYYDLQLFVLGSIPLEAIPGPYSWYLNFARFAAPVATVYALGEAGGALFAGKYRAWRIRHSRGHEIVTGSTTAARALVASLRDRQRRRFWLRRRLVVQVATEAITPQHLRAAGVRGAARLYACGEDDVDCTANVAVAQLASAYPRFAAVDPIQIYAQVSDPRLALALRARWLAAPDPDKPRVDFFSVEELAARACLEAADFPSAPGEPLSIMVVGWGPFATALVVEYALRWRLVSGGRRGRIAVRVIEARQADLDYVRDRWDAVRDMCDLSLVDTFEAALEPDGSLPHRTFVTYADEDRALQTVLMGHELWRGGPRSVVVRVNRIARPEVLDTVGGRLRPISVTDVACRPEVIGEDLVERLAQAIHRQYVRERLAVDPNLRTDSMRDWSELSPDLRAGNHDPARHIGQKLTGIGATASPVTWPRAEFAFTDAEAERLARLEHDRWCAERTRSGWRYGPVRDNDKKTHPSLVPYDELPESEQDKDHQAVRNLVNVLADVGLQIVRLGPSPAAANGTRDDLAGLPRQVSVDT